MTKKTENTSEIEVREKLTQDTITQKDVPMLLQRVTDQIKALKGDSEEEPGTIDVNLGEYGQLKAITDVKTLVKVAAGIRLKKKLYDEELTLRELSPKKFPFEEKGYSFEKWDKYLTYRINEVKHKTKLEQLRKLKSTLEETLSEEDKFRQKMSNLFSVLEEDED